MAQLMGDVRNKKMVDTSDVKEHVKNVLYWRDEYQRLRTEGNSIDDALEYIKRLGAYSPMSIRIVKDVENVTTKEATEIVFQSTAFKNSKEVWKKFWKETDQLLENDENSSN